MNWEQKLQALNALAQCKLIMRKPGDWYVSQSVEVKDGNILCGSYGNGETPDVAVDDHWQVLTNLHPEQCLVTCAYGEKRKAVRWTGFMWDRVDESPAPTQVCAGS
jgi:hypothetical protein